MSDDKELVRLAVFPSEPLARLAEGRLREVNIPCVVKSFGVGPGGWGTAANLPYALYTTATDEMRARQVLDMEPAEAGEQERRLYPRRSLYILLFVSLFILAAAVVLSLADTLFQWILR